MFVKICGITNREDALRAVDAGARAIGFVLYAGSPRGVTPDQVEPWMEDIPREIWKVGIFVNESPVAIQDAATRLHLDIVQLHGDESPESMPSGVRVWKAFRVSGDTLPPTEFPAEAIVLDGPGSGRSFDWSLTDGVKKPFVLAGGLTPDNVAEAVQITKPWGVDTASGVESSPGRKDHARMKMFIKAALRS